MRYIDIGITKYVDAYRFQREILDEVADGVSDNTLLITEHYPIITIGRKGSWDNILKPVDFLKAKGIEILNVDRGGDVTYHCPGQLVAYPIFRLEDGAKDIHRFLDFLEEVGISFLARYGVDAATRPGLRGIWVGRKKIVSIGIGVKKWVTYHGMAINIAPDMEAFSFIRPCGIEGALMTSLHELLGEKIGIYDAKNRLRESFEEISLLAEAVSKGQ